MYLSKHFQLNEFIHSPTADIHHISNVPDNCSIENLTKLCINVLEPLRDAFDCPVHINSGYRSARLNKLVGGVSNSNHLNGSAADIPYRDSWYCWLSNHFYDCHINELIHERKQGHEWIHVSVLV